MDDYEIDFILSGTCTQRIRLVDDCPYTIEEIVAGLNGNSEQFFMTSVGGSGEIITNEGDVVARIVCEDISNNFYDFRLSDEVTLPYVT